METPIISAIAAIAENRALGKDNKLLFHIPEDMRRFKELTTGHAVIMGRKTYESIGRPLPHRTNIVVTRNKDFLAPGTIVKSSVKEAIEYARMIEKEEIFIIGGGEIYTQALPFTDRLYLTVVKGNPEADTFFPFYTQFNKVIKKEVKSSKNYSYTFELLEK